MLRLKSRAEVLAVSPRIEFHGDERKKAVTVKLKFKAVPLAAVEEGFVSQLSLFYGADDESRVPEVGLTVSREVEHVAVEIGSDVPFVHGDMRVDGVQLQLLAKRTVEVTLKLKGVIEDGVDLLHDALMETVDVELAERESPGAEEAEQRAA